MSYRVALVIPICILVAPVLGQAQHSSVKDKDDIEKFFQSKDASENLYLFHDFIRRWGSERLRSLKNDADLSVALRAAWEEICFTLPEKGQFGALTVDSRKLHWFVGFMEGRLNLDLPEYWVKGFVHAEAFRRDNVVFHHLDESIYHATNHNLRVPRDTSVEDRDGGVEFKVGKDSITIPTSQFEKMTPPGSVDHLSALFEPDRCFVLAYDGFFGNGTLFCLERPGGKTVWMKELWLGSSGGARSGVSQFHAASIIKQKERISVVGITGFAAYVEACDSKDGRIIFRFSTSR
jgi:hypothetical protein